MKRERKSENWLQRLQKRTTKPKSSLNSKQNNTSSATNVGSKVVKSEKQSNTSIHNDVNTCPLSIYIDVTCDDSKLKNLIIRGKATSIELEEARFKLITDFSELSNQGESKAISEVMGNFYYQRNIIVGLELALKLVLVGRFENAIDYLNKNGLRCSIPETEEEFQKLIKAVQMRIKNRMVKYKEAQNQYKAMSSGKGEKPTRKYYNKLLVMLSTCDAIKMQLNPKQLTVAEFAEYLNLFNEYQNQLKMRNINHGK